MEKYFIRCSTRICFGAIIVSNIYVNDLPEKLTSLCTIFADDTHLFSKATNEIELNKDLELISQWAYQWKMLFNPDPTKQAGEFCFSHKYNNVSDQPLTFNNNQIQSAPSHKHLGLVLDCKLDFNQHINHKINRYNKVIGIMK